VLDQNPGTRWEEHLGHVAIGEELNPDLAPLPEEGGADAGVSAVPPGDDELRPMKLG
jgi:hypothetical protein